MPTSSLTLRVNRSSQTTSQPFPLIILETDNNCWPLFVGESTESEPDIQSGLFNAMYNRFCVNTYIIQMGGQLIQPASCQNGYYSC